MTEWIKSKLSLKADSSSDGEDGKAGVIPLIPDTGNYIRLEERRFAMSDSNITKLALQHNRAKLFSGISARLHPGYFDISHREHSKYRI